MANLGPNFYPKLVQIASELNMKPEDILAVMVSESGINPSSYEKKYHGSGLIGFMPYTLKNLGFKGDWSDFIKLNGEQQLDYVKTLIKTKMAVNGGPFTSAAQYYVGNFWPIALKLPGIKRGDPNTIFIEENPQTVIDPSTGTKYSKKYYDIGIKINPKKEALAYKANPLFHGSVPGAITYGDMMRQVEKNKKSSKYQQALAAMKAATGYQGSMIADKATNISQPKSHGTLTNFINRLEGLLKLFAYKSQPKNKYLISVGSSSDYSTTLEYGRILSTALQEYLQANTKICADSNNVEIECIIPGDKKIIFEAIKELSVGVSDAFKTATKFIGSVDTFVLVTADHKSDYEYLHPKKADLYNRMFKFKFTRAK